MALAVNLAPRSFTEWRTEPYDRDEDAAYAFGYYLIQLCRDAAVQKVPSNARPETRARYEAAIDVALCSLVNMLEGFWPLSVGPQHNIELALQVRVTDKDHRLIETHEISPCKQDLPIGYWKWAKDREFR